MDVHVHKFRERNTLPFFIRVFNKRCLFGISGTSALRAWNVHIGQKLYVQADLAGAVTYGAAKLSCIIGKITSFISHVFGICRFCKYFSQFIVDIGISSSSGADIDANRSCIDQFCLGNPCRVHRKDMGRQSRFCNSCLYAGNKAFQNKSGLSRTGNTGYNGKTAFGDIYLKWFYCMDGTGRKGDGPMFKQVIFLDHRTQAFGVSRL